MCGAMRCGSGKSTSLFEITSPPLLLLLPLGALLKKKSTRKKQKQQQQREQRTSLGAKQSTHTHAAPLFTCEFSGHSHTNAQEHTHKAPHTL